MIPGFSFGSSKQSSQSTSVESSLSASNSFSLSSGMSQSTSGGQSSSSQHIAFEDLLRSLYGGATDATAARVADAPLFEAEANQLFTGGLSFLDQLQKPAGSDYLSSRIDGVDEAANADLDELGSSLGQFFDERLMPAITSRGVSTGTLGGSRQGVSIGRAAGEVGRTFSSGAAQIISQSRAARDAAAGSLYSGSVNAAGAGLSALPSLLGLKEAGMNAGISPYLALSNIIGSPTVLGESESSQSSQSTSEEIARAISEAMSQSHGESQSSSKGKAFSFGIGTSGGAATS